MQARAHLTKQNKKRSALVAEIIINNCRYESQMLQLDKQQVY